MGTTRADDSAFATSVERGLRLAIGVVILVKTSVFAAALTTRTSYEVVDVALTLIVVVCVAIAGGRCVSGRASGLDVALCTLAMVAGALLHRGTLPLAGSADSPIIHLVEPMLLVVAACLPAGLICAIGGLYVGLRWQMGGIHGLHYGLQEAVFIGGTVLGVIVLVTLMRRASVRAESALRAEGVRSAANASRADIDAIGFLHDDLIPTLMGLSSMPRAEPTRAAAAHALDGLTSTAPTHSEAGLAARVQQVADTTGLDVLLVLRGRRTSVPDDVADALVGAVREALRNVSRHSGRHRSTVTLSQWPGRVTITVEDAGVGFAASPGVGLRVAVTGRVEAVGGTARVTSSPGRGTVVALAWRARRTQRLLGLSPDNDLLTRAAVGRPGRAALQACGTLAAAYAVTALLLAFDGVHTPVVWAGAAATIAITGALALRLDHGPLSLLTMGAACLVPALILGVCLPSVPRSGLGGLASWLVECTALPIMVMAWTTSKRMVGLLLVPNALAIVLVAERAGLPLAELPHLLFVQPLNTFFVAVIIGVCRRAGQVIASTADAAVPDRATATRRLLGPLLPAVERVLTTPSSTDTAEEASAEAAVLAQCVRDCLHFPGPAHVALRTELAEVRRTGCRVVVTLQEAPARTETLAAVITLLRAAGPQRLTISANGSEVKVVTVPAVAAAEAVTDALPPTWVATLDLEATLLSGPPGDLEVDAVSRPGARLLAPG